MEFELQIQLNRIEQKLDTIAEAIFLDEEDEEKIDSEEKEDNKNVQGDIPEYSQE